jgi:hypothetical protein
MSEDGVTHVLGENLERLGIAAHSIPKPKPTPKWRRPIQEADGPPEEHPRARVPYNRSRQSWD